VSRLEHSSWLLLSGSKRSFNSVLSMTADFVLVVIPIINVSAVLDANPRLGQGLESKDICITR
jgi:hypothetical protein